MARGETPRLLIIAGSDSGGGAGIQADVKTATALGVYAATAITAITAQDTQTVHHIHPVPDAIILAQIQAVLNDIGTDAIKTGMLAAENVIKTVRDGIRNIQAPLILDPVMVAKGGAKLLQDDAIDALKSELLPLAYLATPNMPEAEILVGFPVRNADDQIKAAKTLCQMGAKAALVKGGHGKEDQITDILFHRGSGGVKNFVSPRIKTRSTHGTGCTLASAIASFVARGKGLEEAVARARDYVFAAIEHAPDLGKGHGPLNHYHRLYP